MYSQLLEIPQQKVIQIAIAPLSWLGLERSLPPSGVCILLDLIHFLLAESLSPSSLLVKRPFLLLALYSVN
jgi:hypothetical protein